MGKNQKAAHPSGEGLAEADAHAEVATMKVEQNDAFLTKEELDQMTSEWENQNGVSNMWDYTKDPVFIGVYVSPDGPTLGKGVKIIKTMIFVNADGEEVLIPKWKMLEGVLEGNKEATPPVLPVKVGETIRFVYLGAKETKDGLPFHKVAWFRKKKD